MSADDGPGTREVAQRLFAAEFEDADFEYSESDEERAPNYVVTPTGARVNRMFVVGVLTEVETVNENTLRGRVVDPTGAFVSYAGQYQPDEMAFLDRTRPPAFVALTGKARTFQPADSDVVYTSVRPERFAEVDGETRDRWSVSAAEATLRRVAVMRDALAMDARGDDLRRRLEEAGVQPALAAGVPLAIDHYDTGERYLDAVRQLAVQTLEVVADDREEVESLDVSPGERGSADLGPLPAGVEGVETGGDADGADDAIATDDTAGAVGTDGTDDELDEFDTGDVADAFDPDEDDSDPRVESESPVTTEASVTTDESAVENESSVENESTVGGESPVAGGSSTGTESTATEVDDTPTAGDTGTAGPDDPAVVSGTDETATEPDETATVSNETTGFDDTGTTAASAEPTDGDTVDASERSTSGTASGGLDTDETTDPGSFDAGGFDTDASDESGESDELGSFDPEEDDALTEEEREQVEAEYGVGFSSGSEVPDPEESELDAPDPEEITPDPAAVEGEASESAAPVGSDPAGTADTGADGVADTDATDATETSETAAATGTTDTSATTDASDAGATDSADTGADEATDVDLTTAVVEIMAELDEGDGADEEKVKAAAIQRHGATPAEAENAIQDALMNGQCYEAGGGLKPI